MSVRKSNTVGVYESPSSGTVLAPSSLLEVIARLAAENVRLHEQRDHSLQEMEEFLSLVCHELKTPLTSIKGYAQLISRHLRGQASEGVFRELEVIQAQADRLSRIIEDVYNVAKLEGQAVDLDYRPTRLGELIQYVLASLEPEERIRIRLLDPGSLPIVVVDPQRIKRVLTGIVGLALRSFRNGREVFISGMVVEDQVVLTFSDQGAHFPVLKRSELLSRSKWHSSTDRNKKTGFGFDFYINRSILAAHGGSLWAEEPANGGNTVVMVLPLGERETDAISKGVDF